MRTSSISDPDFDTRVTLPLPVRPLLLPLNAEDFARGYVLFPERPPSPVPPEPPPRRRRIGVVLLGAFVVVVAVVAAVAVEQWLRPTPPQHNVVNVEAAQPRPAPTPFLPVLTVVEAHSVAPKPPVPVVAPVVAPKRAVAVGKPKSYGIDEAGF